MKNATSILTTAAKALFLLSVIGLVFSCTSNIENPSIDETSQAAVTSEAPAGPITITGMVRTITYGKDGYTAEVQTETEGNYTALVSIVNLGGREKYQQAIDGDIVTLKGALSELGGVKQLKVSEIISISGKDVQALDAKYRTLTPGDNCWQANKEVNLHAQPSSGSKVEGRHFQGELLSVLGTKTVDNQLWVNVTYKLKVKAGYEGQFADGQVMSSGSPTGWIGGTETPKIECK